MVLGKIWGGYYFVFKSKRFCWDFFKFGYNGVEDWFVFCYGIVKIILRCCDDNYLKFFWLIIFEVFNLEWLGIVLVVDNFFWRGFLNFMYWWW